MKPEKTTDPAVLAYLRELGKRGGRASALALGVDGLSARGRKAIATRWANHVRKVKPKP